MSSCGDRFGGETAFRHSRVMETQFGTEYMEKAFVGQEKMKVENTGLALVASGKAYYNRHWFSHAERWPIEKRDHSSLALTGLGLPPESK